MVCLLRRASSQDGIAANAVSGTRENGSAHSAEQVPAETQQQVCELLVLGVAGLEVAEHALEALWRGGVAQRHQRKY